MKQKPRYADPVWPNAGIEADYRERLQLEVRAMAQAMHHVIHGAWKEAGMAMDAAPPSRYAAGVMFRFQRLVLLLHRTDGLGWAWPGGGVDGDETFMQAVCRECREEMDHDPTHLLDFFTVLDIQNKFGVGYVTYECPLAATFVPRLNPEHDAYMWVAPQVALNTLTLHPGTRETLEDWVESNEMAMDAPKKMRARPPSAATLLNRAMNRWGTTWTKRINDAAEEIATNFATKNRHATERDVKRTLAKAGFTVKFKANPAVETAFQAVIAENVGLIKSIPQEYLTDVQAAVWRSVMSGSDMKTLSEEIHEKYGIAHRRAAFIAQDQNNKAKVAIERARRVEVGIKRARWLHSHAGVVPRVTHVAMNHKLYVILKGMYDKAVNQWIWPGSLPRCRCTDQAEIPGFEFDA